MYIKVVAGDLGEAVQIYQCHSVLIVPNAEGAIEIMMNMGAGEEETNIVSLKSDPSIYILNDQGQTIDKYLPR